MSKQHQTQQDIDDILAREDPYAEMERLRLERYLEKKEEILKPRDYTRTGILGDATPRTRPASRPSESDGDPTNVPKARSEPYEDMAQLRRMADAAKGLHHQPDEIPTRRSTGPNPNDTGALADPTRLLDRMALQRMYPHVNLNERRDRKIKKYGTDAPPWDPYAPPSPPRKSKPRKPKLLVYKPPECASHPLPYLLPDDDAPKPPSRPKLYPAEDAFRWIESQHYLWRGIKPYKPLPDPPLRPVLADANAFLDKCRPPARPGPKRTLTPEQDREVWELRAGGHSYTEIGVIYGMSGSAIRKIVQSIGPDPSPGLISRFPAGDRPYRADRDPDLRPSEFKIPDAPPPGTRELFPLAAARDDAYMESRREARLVKHYVDLIMCADEPEPCVPHRLAGLVARELYHARLAREANPYINPMTGLPMRPPQKKGSKPRKTTPHQEGQIWLKRKNGASFDELSTYYRIDWMSVRRIVLEMGLDPHPTAVRKREKSAVIDRSGAPPDIPPLPDAWLTYIPNDVTNDPLYKLLQAERENTETEGGKEGGGVVLERTIGTLDVAPTDSTTADSVGGLPVTAQPPTPDQKTFNPNQPTPGDNPSLSIHQPPDIHQSPSDIHQPPPDPEHSRPLETPTESTGERGLPAAAHPSGELGTRSSGLPASGEFAR